MNNQKKYTMTQELNLIINEWLQKIISNPRSSQFISTLLVTLLIIIVSALALFIVRKILRIVAHQLAKRTKTEWDDILVKRKFFLAIAHLAPASIIYFSSGFAESFYPVLDSVTIKIGEIYYMFAIVMALNAFLSSINEIYQKSFSFANERPIAGFIQLIKIFMYFVTLLAIIAIIFDKELGKLLTGLGAMAAILLLIFRDTILGFVASIQISMNNMLKIGDWIEMSSRGADGSVIEMNLTTVKVENWDRTIAHIPTYALVTESFTNWKGMEQSGGRRIKRSINIDMNSVKFCNLDMLEKFQKFILIKDYVEKKQVEIEEYNAKLKVTPDQHFNGRRQTNMGIFRKYLEAYLQNNPNINTEMTFLIRHLQPTEKGIPIEVYVFSKDKRWAMYEAIQADIFDHILAILPEFELKIFQAPSGSDIKEIIPVLKK